MTFNLSSAFQKCALLSGLLLSGAAVGHCQEGTQPSQDPAVVTPAPILRPMPTPTANTVVPMTFPVLGKVDWEDSFNPIDSKKGRIHHGEDLMAAKMTPLVAAFDGIVFVNRTPGHNMLRIEGDNGYACIYCHINDDTPGTKDHTGSDDYAYAPGLKSGDHIVAGQLVAWVGDSGNARGGPPHCHFELTCREFYLNPAYSLRAARKITAPRVLLPQPELRPGKGEIRLDGVVRTFDGGKTLVMRALAITLPDGKTTAIANPTRRYVTLSTDTVLRARDLPETPLTLEDLQPELPIIIIGQDHGADKAVTARLAASPPPAVDPASTRALAGGVPNNLTNNSTNNRTNNPTNNPSSDATSELPATLPSRSATDRAPERSASHDTPARSSKAPRSRSTPPLRVLTSSEVHLVELLNAFRREHKLPELTLDAHLSQVAWKHSLDMATAGFYGHTGSDGNPLAVRLNLAEIVSRSAVENLAVNFTAEEQVVGTWLMPNARSRRNLLDPTLTTIGVAHVYLSGDATHARRVEDAWTLILIAP